MGDGLFAKGRVRMNHYMDFKIITFEGMGAHENVMFYHQSSAFDQLKSPRK